MPQKRSTRYTSTITKQNEHAYLIELHMGTNTAEGLENGSRFFLHEHIKSHTSEQPRQRKKKILLQKFRIYILK